MNPLRASGSQPGAASGSRQEAGLDAKTTLEGQEATGVVFRPEQPQLTKNRIEGHEDSEALQEQVANSIVKSQITSIDGNVARKYEQRKNVIAEEQQKEELKVKMEIVEKEERQVKEHLCQEVIGERKNVRQAEAEVVQTTTKGLVQRSTRCRKGMEEAREAQDARRKLRRLE